MVIVLGSSGFLGENLCSYLLKQRLPVLGLDVVTQSNVGFPFIEFDMTKQSLKSIGEAPETLVLLSSVSSHPAVIQKRAKAIELNLLALIDIIQDFIQMGGKHVIFASSEWVYSETKLGLMSADPRDNVSPYGRQKMFGEIIVQELSEAAKIKFTNLRLGIIWGNRAFGSAVETITSSIITNKNSIEVSHLQSGRRFVHVGDVCRAITGVIKNSPTGTFDIQGAEVITMGKIIKSVTNIIGVKDIQIKQRDSHPDARYLKEKEIFDLPFEWRVGNFAKDIRNLVSRVHVL